VLEEARDGEKQFAQIDLASYSNQTFGMYAGEAETVTMRFPERLVGVAVDRFGKEVSLRRAEDGSVRVRTTLNVSNQFFGWLAGLGKEVGIVSPEWVREQYRDYLQEILLNAFD